MVNTEKMGVRLTKADGRNCGCLSLSPVDGIANLRRY